MTYELQELTTDYANQLRPSRTEYDLATNKNICQFVSIRGIRGLCGIGVLGKQCRPKQTVAVCFCAYILVNNLNKYMQQPNIGCSDQPQFLAGFWRL